MTPAAPQPSFHPGSADTNVPLERKAALERVIAVAAEVVLGKEHELRLALACLLARGHLLIEDLPGVGKTTLTHVLARALGYRDARAERRLPQGRERRELLADLTAVMTPALLITLQQGVSQVHVSDALRDYVQALLLASRQSPQFREGLSPRAGLSLLRAAQAGAVLAGRGFVMPEDVQAVLVPVVHHRLQPAADFSEAGAVDFLRPLTTLPIP